MAERKRSHDRSRDTDAFLSGAEAPGQQGREGGDLAREIGTEDEMKRAGGATAGATRVHKAEEDRPGASKPGSDNR